MNNDYLSDFGTSNDERIQSNDLVSEFIMKLREKSAGELGLIITRYIGYKPETVEAALFVAVEKGLISYDLKTELLRQIDANFAAHIKGIKFRRWESENAFLKYVERYDDEAIYSIIEDTKGIVIDVYHAVLQIAKQRELISADDFEKFYSEAITATLSDREIENREIEKSFSEIEDSGPQLTDEELVKEAEKFWKCPKCNELVDMELALCWNCEAETPEVVEHPDKEEIRRNISVGNTMSPVKVGFTLVVCGILLFLFGFDSFSAFHHTHFGRFVFGGFFFLMGLFFIGYGLFFNSRLDDPGDK